eukprot:8323034-Pyramimonas_sp.AAC.1
MASCPAACEGLKDRPLPGRLGFLDRCETVPPPLRHPAHDVASKAPSAQTLGNRHFEFAGVEIEAEEGGD